MNTFPLNSCRVQFPSAVVVLTGGSRPDYRVVRRSFNRSAVHSHVSAGPRHSDVPTSSRHFLEAFLKNAETNIGDGKCTAGRTKRQKHASFLISVDLVTFKRV